MSKRKIFDPPVATSSDEDNEAESEMEEDPPKQAASPPPPLKSALKRPVRSTVEESDSKRAYFQRIWSEEDEIILLQGMIDFHANTGTSPYDNKNEFFDSIKNDFGFKPSKTQLLEKIRGLKKKFRAKGTFTKAHDVKSMGLAKCIWGVGGFAYQPDVVKPSNGRAKRSKKKSVKSVEEEEEEKENVLVQARADRELATFGKPDWLCETSFFNESIVGYGLDECYVKHNWSSVPMDDKKEVEEKYELFHAQEIEYVRFKNEFLRKVSPMVYKSI